MAENTDCSVDVAGVGKVAQALPKEAWARIVDTACDTFVKCIYPLTATTEGIGRLIEHKFNMLTGEQKVIASRCFQDAASKIADTKDQHDEQRPPKPLVAYEALGNTESQTDETMRELWANLLAREFIDGSVHPAIAKLLGEMTSQDALLLARIAEREAMSLPAKVLKVMLAKFTLGTTSDQTTFNHRYLEKLGLVHEQERVWYLTVTGREFMRCVSDPH